MLTVEKVLVTRPQITDDEYLIKKGGMAFLRLGLSLYDMITQEYYIWVEVINEKLVRENLRALSSLCVYLPANVFCCVESVKNKRFAEFFSFYETEQTGETITLRRKS